MNAGIRAEKRAIGFEPEGRPHTFRAYLAADFFYFQGHFDDLPLLPGVVQLSRVVLPLARREYPDLARVRGLRRVRFKRPIGPNKTITVALSRSDLRVSFEITVDGRLAASGTLIFDAGAQASD